MSWRCANNVFGYCSDAPRWNKEPHTTDKLHGSTILGGKCDLNPKECGCYLTASEAISHSKIIEGKIYRHVEAKPAEESKESKKKSEAESKAKTKEEKARQAGFL